MGGSDFLVPLSYVQTTLWPANQGPLIYEAKVARTPYLLAHGPDTSAVATNPMTVTQGTPSNLTATINFAWTGDSFAQNVGAAEYYVDTPPWAPGNTAIAMQGTFGGAQTVNVSATVDTSSLAPGRHLIFVRGRGVSPYGGYLTWGAISAAWLWVTPVQGTPTPTVTGTPPTATQTRTATMTPAVPSATPTTCAANLDYTIQQSTGATIVPGLTDTGNHCDDCLTTISLPFPVSLYDQSFTGATVDSDGTLQFIANSSNYLNSCLPDTSGSTYTIYGHWDDLLTNGSGQGVFTSVSGSAPNRVFNVEWRAALFSGGAAVNFEIRLNENSPNFDIVYGAVGGGGSSATSGVQKDATRATQFSCNSSVLTAGLDLTFMLPPCGSVTPTPGASTTPTRTGTPTAVPPSATATSAPPSATGAPPSATNTLAAATRTPGAPTVTSVPPTATATGTPCAITFSDVHPADYWYIPVQYLYCHLVISGYGDGTFRPFNATTRSQMVKIVVLGFAKPISTPPGGNFTFADVPPGFPFFAVIETAAAGGIVSGYTCGGPGEPCDAQHRAYFRPYANVTRGQLSKIDVLAAGWALLNPASRTFEDVLRNTAFYSVAETAACHGVISGYACGGPGEPCGTPPRPYFRQNSPAVRAQIAKIVYLSITNPPGTCGGPSVAP